MSTKFIALFSIIAFLNLPLFSSVFAENEQECKKIEKTPGARLKKYLFCEYEPWYLTSPNDGNATEITIQLAPSLAIFDEENGNLELSTWFGIAWSDPYLSWDPSSFEDTLAVPVDDYDLWRPEIAIISAANEKANTAVNSYYTPCWAIHVGSVMCHRRQRFTIRCQTDFTQWPFDRQNCTLVISVWMRSTEEITFAKDIDETLNLDSFHSNEEWTVTATRVSYETRKLFSSKIQPEATAPILSIDFILDRVHNKLNGQHISSAMIMIIMTLTTLWLNPRSVERLAMACLNLVIHLYCVRNLHRILPNTGSTVPSLQLFYSYSLVLATVTLLLTFFLGSLQEIKVKPPKWMSSATVAILRSKTGQILLLSMLDPKIAAQLEPDADDAGDLISANSKTTAWGYVTIMCGWISFLACFIAYVIMGAVLIPNSSMRPPVNNLVFRGLFTNHSSHL